ncbi:DUF4259 domain-containing protein [Alteribacter aurantiacus]|uniref:DUF4259 domain-containing protein n=1 Tax=Alteribacter aurantiacus TaxID=254410 RepID=UPI000411AC70|nr:DUF4259 domain-containing protein [Alteribacter aurantiacus]
MGAWDTGIFDDDTACDVRDEFLDYLEQGHSPKEATEFVLEDYLEEYSFDEDQEILSLVFYGLAAVQLEKNCLQEDVKVTTIKLIIGGADLEMWEGAGEEEYKNREKVLTDLKSTLEQV